MSDIKMYTDFTLTSNAVQLVQLVLFKRYVFG